MTLAEALVAARERGRQSALKWEDIGFARRDAALLLVAQSEEAERALAEAGYGVEWYEGSAGKGYVVEPDIEALGYPRTVAALAMADALRAGGFHAAHLFRSYE